MLESFVQTVVAKLMQTKYAHLEKPAAMQAKITGVSGSEEHPIYNLKILDQSGQVDSTFPEIPNVRARQLYEYGDIVVVLLLYGQMDLYIIGKAGT